MKEIPQAPRSASAQAGSASNDANSERNVYSRRGMLMGAAAVATTGLMAAQNYEQEPTPQQDAALATSLGPPWAYIGCYTGGANGRGISVYHVDTATNAMTLVNVVGPVNSPSFIVLDPTRKFLYSGNEGGSTVSAFSINPTTGSLRLLNTVAAGGSPAHVIVHPGGKHVLAANYGGSSVAVFPIQADGSLGAASQVIAHFGDFGPNAGRQEAPHPHMCLPDSTGKFVLVNDLGLDATFVYSFDTTAGRMTEVSRIYSQAGAGPRHLAWHPNGRIVYSISELNNALNTYAWDGNGGLTSVQENVSTLPAGFRGNAGAGEVLVDAAGKFLYASNRLGFDSIAIFSIDPATFRLTLVGFQATQGRTPRHFNFDPSGSFIHVCHQDSANIVSFKVDKTTGLMTPTGQYLSTPGSSCIQFNYPG